MRQREVPRQRSGLGLVRVGGPFVVGVVGGYVTGAAANDLGAVVTGLLVTGIGAAVLGRGIVGLIAVMLGTPIASILGTTVRYGDVWGGDLAVVLLITAVLLGVLVPAGGYGVGRMIAGALRRTAPTRSSRLEEKEGAP